MNSSKFNDQLKVEASKILLKIVQVYNHILTVREEETFKLVGLLSEELKKSSLPDCRANLLECMGALVCPNYAFSQYRHLLDYCIQNILKPESVKIQSICLLNVRKFLGLFP